MILFLKKQGGCVSGGRNAHGEPGDFAAAIIYMKQQVKSGLRRQKSSAYDKSVITKQKTKGGIKMLYNSYAVTSYTYEDYKKTSYSRTSSSYSTAKNSASTLALKILAVIVMVIVAVTAGLNLAPSAEKVSASNTSGHFQQTAQADSNTILF